MTSVRTALTSPANARPAATVVAMITRFAVGTGEPDAA
jgi:hypothetical protein